MRAIATINAVVGFVLIITVRPYFPTGPSIQNKESEQLASGQDTQPHGRVKESQSEQSTEEANVSADHVGAVSGTEPSNRNQEVQNLRAFAKLYGYVKYFHPSDEASAIDWDAFAIHGVQRIKETSDREELKAALEELFLPIAPSIQIRAEGEEPRESRQNPSKNVGGLKVVAWQHLGFGGTPNWLYKSVRLNRKRVWIGQTISLANQTERGGKQIRLRAVARADLNGTASQAQLRMKVARKWVGSYAKSRSVKTRQWKAYEIVGEILDYTTELSFGFQVCGTGRVWGDEFELSVMNKNNEWEAIDMGNPNFEEEGQNAEPTAWNFAGRGYACTISRANPYKGEKCLLVEGDDVLFSERLFEKHPGIGDAVNKPLGSDLLCQIPLALYSDEYGTLPRGDGSAFSFLSSQLEDMNIDEATTDDENIRLADVVIAWNVFQHFYPYFDVVEVDWDSELTHALQKAMRDKSREDFWYTLNALIVGLQDGHATVSGGNPPMSGLPMAVDWIQDRVVVVAAADSTGLRQGDVVLSIDGVPAEAALSDAEKNVSGSAHWRRSRALDRWFGTGRAGSKAILIVNRGSQMLEVEIERTGRQGVSIPSRPQIEEIEDNVYYVDLRRAGMNEVNDVMDTLAQARGVVFDVRGYPNRNHDVICHLLDQEDVSDRWLRVPQIIYPDSEDVVGYRDYGWQLRLQKPRIAGKVVFLVDARAISYAESFMGFVEHYKLGEIVGQPTAGTNGDITGFSLPGGHSIGFTGMRVVKHDGSQHHLIGVQPTVPVKRTIHGLIEGRDEYLQKALEIVNRQTGP